jgi:hypothetical protein
MSDGVPRSRVLGDAWPNALQPEIYDSVKKRRVDRVGELAQRVISSFMLLGVLFALQGGVRHSELPKFLNCAILFKQTHKIFESNFILGTLTLTCHHFM